MLAAIAAATFGMSYQPPVVTQPEDVDARGYALVFSREDRGQFSVFVKDPGKRWSDVPKVEETAEKYDGSFDWVVFHTIVPNVDVVLHTFRNKEELKAQPTSDDLTGYFDDEGIVADNNFGLHDIY
jgi:hypothetical protein